MSTASEREGKYSLSEGIVFSGGGVMWPHAFQKWFISGIIKTYVVKYAILVHQPHGVFIKSYQFLNFACLPSFHSMHQGGGKTGRRVVWRTGNAGSRRNDAGTCVMRATCQRTT